MNSSEFRSSLVSVAAEVMHCEYCAEHALPGDQLQPGWVGRDYVRDRSVVFVLQNPAVAPADYDPRRESLLQDRLRDFSASPSTETYEGLMQAAFSDMTGVGVRPWAKWRHPIGKLFDQLDRAAEDLRAIQGCSHFAWMNVVKFRTRDNETVPPGAAQHGIDIHLRGELELLRPRALVSVGGEAKRALRAIPFSYSVLRGHLKLQGASNKEVKALQILLHEGGVYL